MITLKEIAAQAEVSIATVSNILNGKSNVSENTKERVLQIVKETGYRPNFMARSLRSAKTHTVGLIIDDISAFSSPYLIDGLVNHFEACGYKPLIENLRFYTKYDGQPVDEFIADFESAYREMLAIKVDGLVYVASHSRQIDYLSDKNDLPIVLAYAYTKEKEIPEVNLDDENASFTITNYLISKGNKKIAAILGRKDSKHTDLRFNGFKRALESNGLSVDKNIVYNGEWSRESGYASCKNLLEEKHEFSAIFCFNDLMAAGVYDCLAENNLVVGKDIDVVGFDNREFSDFLNPALTTMSIPLEEIGIKAAETLLLKIDNPNDKIPSSEIACKFIERASVK